MKWSKIIFLISSFLLFSSLITIGSAWATKYSLISGRRFSGGARKIIIEVANLPHQVYGLIQFVSNQLPPAGEVNPYTNNIGSSGIINKGAGYVLTPYVDSNGVSRVILLGLSNQTSKEIFLYDKNLKNPVYTDSVPGSSEFVHSAYSSRHRVTNPYLTKNGRLYFIIPWNDLVCFNTVLNKEEWRVRGAFHHSLEMDSEGYIWACGSVAPGSLDRTSKVFIASQIYEDQAIIKISNSGKIADIISITDLLTQAGMEYLLFGCSNPRYIFDPIHLNHVNPVNENNGKIKKGSLLVSLRNLSTILLIDPIMKKIEWHQTGPWMNQHCVNPIGQSKISVLDNHAFLFGSGQYWLDSGWETRVLTHDLEKNQTEVVNLNLQKESIQIPIEGKVNQISPEGWMIEDSVRGTIFIFENKKVTFKWSNLYPNGRVGYTSWSRFMRADEVPDSFK